MRVALVHDWLTGLRGGERVLDQFVALYPDAEIHTLFHVAGSTTPRIETRPIHASPLSALPGVARHYRKLLPLYPWAVSRLRPLDVDVVISVHHAVAKAVPVPAGATHVCYCLTPMRYVWDQADAYLGRGLRRALAAPLVAALRRSDTRSARPDRVSRFLAISHAVAARVREHYGRAAVVVYPPVDTETFRPSAKPPEDYFLLVGGFVPYKREALALDAFSRLGRRLVVVGDGPQRRRLAARAAPNIEFTGRVSEVELAGLYANCRALVYPQQEDFGLVAVEAQAAGRPVIAFGRGGAAETVVPHGLPRATRRPPTGVWFDAQTPEALADAVLHFERVEADFDARAIRTHSTQFGVERFRAEIRAEIDRALHGRAA